MIKDGDVYTSFQEILPIQNNQTNEPNYPLIFAQKPLILLIFASL